MKIDRYVRRYSCPMVCLFASSILAGAVGEGQPTETVTSALSTVRRAYGIVGVPASNSTLPGWSSLSR